MIVRLGIRAVCLMDLEDPLVRRTFEAGTIGSSGVSVLFEMPREQAQRLLQELEWCADPAGGLAPDERAACRRGAKAVRKALAKEGPA